MLQEMHKKGNMCKTLAYLSHDFITRVSDITPCNKIDLPHQVGYIKRPDSFHDLNQLIFQHGRQKVNKTKRLVKLYGFIVKKYVSIKLG